MSKRTSEASKAVRKAWEKERQLVLQGEGTRDWTREQQKDIIEIGKAYDNDGKAFEGHHMKSAEAYPEYQGDENNIQFLSRKEHLDAHYGSFCNATNGYYDYNTRTTIDFEDGKYKTCKNLKLSNPIINEKQVDNNLKCSRVNQNQEIITKKVDSYSNNTSNEVNDSSKKSLTRMLQFFKQAKNKIKKGLVIYNNHPEINNSIKMILNGASNTINNLSSFSSKKNNLKNQKTDIHQSSESELLTDSIALKDYPENRKSPVEHEVSPYVRIQNGKVIHVDGYKRGKNS